MASIGPQMPPSPSKRKRTPDDKGDDTPPTKQARNTDEINLEDDESSDDGFGPSAPTSHGPSAPKPAAGPSLPPNARANTDEIDLDASDDENDALGPSAPSTASHPPSSAAKASIGPSLPPKRTMGPALPPPSSLPEPSTSTSGPEPPTHDPGSDSDSDSDDYAPALPGSTAAQAHLARQSRAAALAALEPAAAPAPPQRDDWMLAPPPAGGGYNERDPSKIKSRRFASNKPHSAARSGGGGPAEISSIWTETPEQKRKRLEDAVLGRAAPAGSDLEQQRGGAAGARPTREEERARRTAENLEAVKGKSLYETHMSARKEGERRKDEEEEDDPSARAFDREKDMALGGRINSTQRRELLGKAKDFGGRFQKGSYL